MTKVGQYRFNKSVTIQSKTKDANLTHGQQGFTWGNLYTDIRVREISPLRTTESMDERQPTAKMRKSWLVRLLDRSIDAEMRLVHNSLNHYITGVRDYKEDRLIIVIDTETRDDE